MTSQEIQAKRPVDAMDAVDCAEIHGTSPLQLIWLREIAYQLAASREQAQKRHEENLRQRDAFLTSDREYIPVATDAEAIAFAKAMGHDLADPKPAKTDPEEHARQNLDSSERTAAALRSCARTILEEQLSPTKASDYLNTYADAFLSHEANRTNFKLHHEPSIEFKNFMEEQS